MSAALAVHDHDLEYDQYINRINERIATITTPIFQTDIDPDTLYDFYLATFEEGAERQYHTCSCCRAFIKHYGGLVTVDANGRLDSLVWDIEEAPPRYQRMAGAMDALVSKAKIVRPFLSSDRIWGTPETGIWHHFAVLNKNLYVDRLKTANQMMAEKREDYKNLLTALGEFKPAHVDQVVTLVRAEAFDGSEKVLGQALFLQQLHALRDSKTAGSKTPFSQNLMWQLIATAPAGFCHPRASLIGTLLEDLAAGKSFDRVAAAFKAKIHPLQYQRPQAAPTAGAIAAAEKQFEAAGLAPALLRRFATLDDIQVKLWERKVKPAPAAGGIFGHLQAKGTEPPVGVTVPMEHITFDRFRRKILPLADKIEYLTQHGNYTALTAAADPAAPPILQWDSEEHRNTVAWYLYHGGSGPNQWNLPTGRYVEVTAVTLKPFQWGDETAFSHQGNGVLFVLDGAVDTNKGTGKVGNALFPACLKADLHGMRSVIEAYSRKAELSGEAQASACGIQFDANSPLDVRVTSGGQALHYRIDRFE